MTGSDERETKRKRERVARQRRMANLEHMRVARHTLQNAVLAVRTLHEVSWERFLNPDAMRVRHFLLAAKQAITLKSEQVALQRLLHEREHATDAVSRLLIDHQHEDWSTKFERSREVFRKHYRPRSAQECQVEIETALRQVDTFQWNIETDTAGVQFLGWRERRRIDHARHLLHFQFYKVFRGHDIMDSVNASWDTYTDASTFQQVIIGHRFLGSLEILQQLGPNAMIFRVMERFPGIPGDIHVVYLVFRMRTEQGYTQCVRSLYCPEVITAIAEPQDVWPSNFVWKHWREGTGEGDGYRLRIGGSLFGRDVNYLNQWMVEVFGCVLRGEHLATKTTLVTSN